MGDFLSSIDLNKYLKMSEKGISISLDNGGDTNTNINVNISGDNIETIDFSINTDNKTNSDTSVDNEPKKRTDLIQKYINTQVIDSNEGVDTLDEMEEKTKRDIKLLEDRRDDAKKKLDSLKNEFENAKSDLSVYVDALPDDKKWMEKYGMTKKDFQDMINQMSEHIGLVNQTIKSDKELLKKIPYLKKMDTKEFSEYVNNYKSNWQSDVNYDEVFEQYSYGHNLKSYSKLDGKDVDWISVIEYMLAKDKTLVIGEHDELRETYLKYEAMDESQRMMYHYLFEKEGMDSAQEYLSAISDDINKNIALNRVERRIKSMASNYKLDENGHITQASIDSTIENLIGIYGAGFDEALKGNYSGLFKYGEENYTIEEYEQMYMLQYISQNSTLSGVYDAGKMGGTISNMGVSIAAFSGVTFLTGGTGIAAIAPYLLQAGNVSLSVANTAGNANHYALVNGATQDDADQYSASIARNCLISQVLSAVVSMGVGSTAHFSSILKGTNSLSFPTNVAISATNTLVGATTATWEVSQEQALKSALLHEKPLDLDTATDQMVDAFVSNIIMGSLSEAPGLAMSHYSLKSGDNIFEFSSDDCIEYFRNNPDTSMSDFINYCKNGKKISSDHNYVSTEILLKNVQNDISDIEYEISCINSGEDVGFSGRNITELNNLKNNLESQELQLHKALNDKLYAESEISIESLKKVRDGAPEYVLGEGRSPLSQSTIKERVKAMGLYDELTKSKNMESVQNYAEMYGVSVPDMKKIFDDKVADFVNNSQFGYRLYDDALEKCLDDGYIKNQFETGTSNASIGSGDYRSAQRANAEERLFGISQDTPYSDRPVYGMAFPKGDDDFRDYRDYGPAKGYGNCIIIFNKDSIADSTSFVLGDSLTSRIAPSTVNNPEYTGSFYGFGSNCSSLEEFKNANFYDTFRGDNGNILELQYHGQKSHAVNNTNIKEVIFDSQPSKIIQDKLNAKKIPWRIILPEDDE